MKWIRTVAGAVAMAVCTVPAQAAPSWDCAPPPGAVRVALPSGLPPALRDSIGDIALPGEPFDTTDVYIKGHKHRRYIFVWNVGIRWIVATEQGGIALFSGVSVYQLGKDGKAVLIKRADFTSDVCGAATKLARQ